MNIGNLYSYPNQRNVYNDENHPTALIHTLPANEPFVVLEIISARWVETYKVLTLDGIVGWIHIGYPENVKQITS